MTQPFISLSENGIFTAVRALLLSSTIGANTPVLKGQANRVAEPSADDFIIITPISATRLATNKTLTYDSVFTGSIAAAVLTVASFAHNPGPLLAGTLLTDNPAVLGAGTLLGAQLTGPIGGTGTYAVSPSQTVSSETMYAGIRADLFSNEMVIQTDVHGPNSLNNIFAIAALFRSEVGTDSFTASGFDVSPLYADEPRQAPFINENQQYEDRWTIDLHLQANPVINTPQQFAAQLKIGLIEVDVTYPL